VKRSRKNRLVAYGSSFSFVGMVFAALFFAASVTPSLLPRLYPVQGVLSGLALAIGYGVGVALMASYRFLELPEPSGRVRYVAKRAIVVLVPIVFVGFVWQMTSWQNSIRELMEMERLTTAYPFRVTGIAVALGAILVSVARVFRSCGNYVSSKLERFVPRKIALAAGYLLLVVLVLFVSNDLVAAQLLAAADSFFLKVDQVVGENLQQPTNPSETGSGASLV